VRREDLAVERRQGRGKNFARQIRREGKVPAVLYGKDAEPIVLSVQTRDLVSVLHGQESHNMLLNMKVAGEETGELLSMPKDIQFDPVDGHIVHVDFQQIHLNQTIRTEIPVHLSGTAQGVKEGGILEHILREIEIECLPMDIPEYVEIDISAMTIGDSVHVSDLDIMQNDKIEVLIESDRSVATVVAPRLEEEEEAAEEEGEGEGEGEEAEAEEGAEGEEEEEKE
jgi:large subunit ribosomal protein L25